MIVFKKLRYKNILSTGDEFIEYDLNVTDLTLILGKNGGGKTTLIDALNFCLYGKPFREINKDLLINSINGKKLVVEIELQKGSDTAKIVRGIKPNTFEFYINGVLVPKDAKVVDYQKHVDKFVGIGPKSFRSQVVLGSRTYVPFMRLKTEDRRGVIEDLLDLEVYAVMNRLNKEEISDTEKDLVELDKELAAASFRLETEKTRISMVRGSITESVDRLERKIVALQNQKANEIEDREKLQKDLEDLRPKLEPQEEKETTYRQYSSARARFEGKVADHEANIKFYRLNNSCSVCRQDIDATFKAEIIERELTEKEQLEQRIANSEKYLSDLREQLDQLQEIERQINDLRTSIAVKNSTIRSLDIQVDSCHREIRDLEQSSDSFENIEGIIAQWQEAYNLAVNNKNDRAIHLEYLKGLSMVLKDTGLKAQFIKQYIPIMNSLINKYLGVMGFNVAFELNETFSETIKSHNKEAFSYNSFSEGEKMRLDLAILFAWRDVAKMRNTTATNLLIMDEVLDASLDQDGAEDFMAIVRELAKDTNTIIISHKSEHLMDRFSKVIKFTKVKKFSQMKVVK